MRACDSVPVGMYTPETWTAKRVRVLHYYAENSPELGRKKKNTTLIERLVGWLSARVSAEKEEDVKSTYQKSADPRRRLACHILKPSRWLSRLGRGARR